MRANFVRNQCVILKRPAKTTLVALVICGGGCACHTVPAERTARRAGHASLARGNDAGRMASSRPVRWRDCSLSAQRHPPKPACRDSRRRVRIRCRTLFVYRTEITTDHEGARNKRKQIVAHCPSADDHGPLTFVCSGGHDKARSCFDPLYLETFHAYAS